MSYSYKRLTSSDVPLLKGLLAVFGEAFDEPDTYQGKVPSDNYLESLLKEPDFIVLVARSENRIVGGLAAYILRKFEQERKEIYIYDLAVLRDDRRRGVATELIQRLRHVGEEQGAYVIFVQADKGDTAAMKLYESLANGEEVYSYDISIN
jgi:aminoglycoside 3-N-acetyltransferase I